MDERLTTSSLILAPMISHSCKKLRSSRFQLPMLAILTTEVQDAPPEQDSRQHTLGRESEKDCWRHIFTLIANIAIAPEFGSYISTVC